MRTDAPLRLAFADQPYVGKAHLYRGHPDYAGEVDPADVFARLAPYDGWVYCASAESLPLVLGLAPPLTRVAAWVRGARPHPNACGPLNAWEPVLYKPARWEPSPSPAARLTDVLEAVPRARTSDPGRVIGAKPGPFLPWAFDLMGARPGDELDDLFPGSGGVARAWEAFNARAAMCRAVGTSVARE